MRQFDYTKIPEELLAPEIMNLVARIHEHKGKQALFTRTRPDILAALSKAARLQGAGASTRMDGIIAVEPRLKALMEEEGAASRPRNRSEAAIVGYRNALIQIHERHDELRPDKETILRLHEELCGIGAGGPGGKYRTAVYGIEALAEALERAEFSEGIDPLVLTAMFTLDFLCMQPFRDGNGRMSRLLALLLLFRNGFLVGKYVSLELLIEKTSPALEEKFGASSQGWHSGGNTYLPFVRYYLETILRAYEDFAERLEPAWDGRRNGQINGRQAGQRNKSDRIRYLFRNPAEKWTKKAISAWCPDISIAMIEWTLARLLAEGCIRKVGSGRSTAYVGVSGT